MTDKPKNLLAEFARLEAVWTDEAARIGRYYSESDKQEEIRTLAYLEYINECREKGLVPENQ